MDSINPLGRSHEMARRHRPRFGLEYEPLPRCPVCKAPLHVEHGRHGPQWHCNCKPANAPAERQVA